MRNSFFSKILFFIILVFFLSTKNLFSQQTIFNVPSADIVEKNKIFIQHESQLRTKNPDSFINTTNYIAYGIGKETELDTTLFNLSSPSSNNISLGIGFKNAKRIDYKLFKNIDNTLIIGSMIPISLNNNGVGNWTYVENSLYINNTKTRITGGVSYGTKQIFGKEIICFLGGFEQKINDRLNIIGDWYSKNHNLGIAALGLSYAAPDNLTFYGGLQIPNNKTIGRQSIIFEIAKIF